jgi:DNA polymerase-3 subunit alpha
LSLYYEEQYLVNFTSKWIIQAKLQNGDIMFISLHNHTQWSILDSTVRIKDLFARAKDLNQTAIAITDHATTVAGLDALKESRATGIKLIIGSEVYFRHNPKDNDEQFKHLILIAKNDIGYKNLLTLQAKGYDNIEQLAKKCYSVLDWKLLEQYSEGLICLTSCGNGIIAQHIMNKDMLLLKNLF